MSDPSSDAGFIPPESAAEFDPWKVAKARFLEGLDEKETALFQEATVENIYYSASNTEREDRKQSKSRAALQSLQPLVSAVEDYGKAFDTFTNIASLYLAPIWGCLRVVLVIASNHGRFYDTIITTFGHIGDTIPRFRDYQRIFDVHQHQRFMQALAAAYLDIIHLCTEFKDLLRNQKTSTVRRFLQPLSPSIKARIEEAVEIFRKHRKAVEKEAEVCHMIEEKKARELVLRNNAAAEAREREMEQKRLVDQLSTIDYQYKHRRMQRVRHPGTGSSFMALPELKDWQTSSSSAILCCYGIPGCGKSVLVSSLIDEMLSPGAIGEVERTTLFYYCDHADKRTLEPTNMFGSLTQQLLRTMGVLPDTILSMIQSLSRGGSIIEDLRELLLTCIIRVSKVTLFVDGLDEILEKDREDVFSNLKGLLAGSQKAAKLFVSAREDITYGFQIPATNIDYFKIRICAATICGDIDNYVQHAVRELIGRGDLSLGDPTLEEEIILALAAGAKGMFLWVKFQLYELCSAETDDAIRKVLQDLPRDLSETYDRLLSRIDRSERREYIKRMFQWIVFARRPLHASELREAIAFTIEDKQWDASKIPNNLQRLVRASGNLILIDEDTDNVQLAHYSVQQYLLDQHRPSSSGLRISKEEANAKLGEICLSYLSFSDFETQVTKHTDTVTPSMAALGDIVATQSLLPVDSPAIPAVNALRKIRGSNPVSTKIAFARHLPERDLLKKDPELQFKEKYKLLSYIVDNWLWHCMDFKKNMDNYSRNIQLFDELALQKTLPFPFRPWDSTKSLRPTDIQQKLAVSLGWAIAASHMQLLQALLVRHDSSKIQICLRKAITWFFSTAGYSINSTRVLAPLLTDIMLDELQDCTLDPLCLTQDWKCWLYCQLLRAAREGQTEVVLLLLTQIHMAFLDESEDCISEELVFSHLIFEAVGSGHTSLVKSLCDNKLTPRPIIWIIKPIGGLKCNAVEHAAILGLENMVELLLRKGCSTSHRFSRIDVVRSLLHSAIKNYDKAVARCLLILLAEPKGDPLLLDWDVSQAEQPIHLKVSDFHLWVPPNQHHWKTEMIAAATANGLTTVVEGLLSTRLSPMECIETSIWDFQCALLTALYNIRLEIFHSLLTYGIGTTALQLGFPSATVELTQLWLSGAAIIPLRTLPPLDSLGNSLLDHAFTFCETPNLLQASVSEQKQQTTLQTDVKNIIYMLLRNGMKLETSKDVTSLLLEAIINGQCDRVEALLLSGAEIRLNRWIRTHTTFHTVYGEKESILSRMDRMGYDLDIMSVFHLTPLMWAILHAQRDVVKTLLAAGASPRLSDLTKYTPLHFAIIVDSLEMVQLLMVHGADATVQDERGRHILKFALECKSCNSRWLIIQFLVHTNHSYWQRMAEDILMMLHEKEAKENDMQC